MRNARYRSLEVSEAQFQPGSRGRVLLNKLAIKCKREIDLAEYDALLLAQQLYLTLIGPETRFTAMLLKQMHREWLGSIYPWAGEYRTLELSKDGFSWPPAFRVPDNMAAFEAGLLRDHTPCRSGSLHAIARVVAIIHAEFLLIHPFREGNGRLARWIADLMAAQAGLPPPQYHFTGRGSRERNIGYIKAVQQGYIQNYGPLTRFFLEALERGLRSDA